MEEQKKPEEKSVLVTVGSTQFEDLIEAVDTVEFGELLIEKGFTKLLIQFGALGIYEPHLLEECCRSNQEFKNKKFTVEAFRMNPEFGKIMKSASLVISHAGSGTILEGLRLSLPLIVVVNETLMNNHQAEIADVMDKDHHVFKTNVSTLLETLRTADLTTLQPFPPPQTALFATYLDDVMGFT